MPLGAKILEFKPVYPSVIGDTLDFSKPIDDGIRIMSADYLISSNTVFYGDLINLQFWRMLGLPFGSVPTPSSPLTLQQGYRYVYNNIRRVFDVYDNNGVNILHVTGITSISDLNIDFTIHKSHQFEIIVDPSMFGDRFIFPATLYKEQKESQMAPFVEHGVDNICGLDLGKDVVIDGNHYNFYDKPQEPVGAIDIHKGKFILYDLIPLHYFFDIRWQKNCPTNYFHLCERFSPEQSKKLEQKFRAEFFNFEKIFKFLLAMLSVNLFPRLMPIQGSGETQNNRPLYEPWLIYKMEFMVNKYTIDEDDTFVIPVFDLSPHYA